jgi:F0F1-type ATP synthase membrane subunit b/b'
MIERDLLNLIKNSEEEAQKIIELAQEEVKKLKVDLEEQKREIVDKLNVKLDKSIKAKKEELQRKFEEDLTVLKKENERRLKNIREISSKKIPELSKILIEKVVGSV